jgi:dTDP-4-dehydrorhamnose 3,5-epimerase
MTEVRPLGIPGALEITPARAGDHRGSFSETYRESVWAGLGVLARFVQDNQSRSAARFTLRGLHFQIPPHAQDKLVRVLKGRAWDVVVDLRRGSPRYGQWEALELSAETGNQMFVPAGLAHGFLTLEPETEVLYKVSAEYAPEHERGILWNDPAIGVAWPLGGVKPVLSNKDVGLPLLAALESPFELGR